jgi:hypothetical protein
VKLVIFQQFFHLCGEMKCYSGRVRITSANWKCIEEPKRASYHNNKRILLMKTRYMDHNEEWPFLVKRALIYESNG